MHPQKSLLRNKQLNAGPHSVLYQPDDPRAILWVRTVYVDLPPCVNQVQGLRPIATDRIFVRSDEITASDPLVLYFQIEGRMKIKGLFS